MDLPDRNYLLPSQPLVAKSYAIEDTVEAKSKLSLDLQTLLDNGQFADVTLTVKGNQWFCHKAILSARSPVFEAMFRHNDTQESHKNCVEITDVNADVFEEFLRYIYTEKALHLDQLAAELLSIADKV